MAGFQMMDPTPMSMVHDSRIASGYGQFGQPLSLADATRIIEEQKAIRRQESADASLKQAIASGQIELPEEALRMIQAGMPVKQAIEMWNTIADNQRSQQMNDFIFGGGGMGNESPESPDNRLNGANKEQLERLLMHPTFGPYAKAKLDAMQREEDLLNEMAKEERAEERKIKEEERKPPTESQANSANYATRMAEAENILTPLEDSGVSTANMGERALETIPLVGNYMTSDDYKLYRQAQEDWVRAKLRKESGAVIADSEMEREITTYFPQPGDTKQVIEQKRKARDTAVQGVAAGAKPGFKVNQINGDASSGGAFEGWSMRRID